MKPSLLLLLFAFASSVLFLDAYSLNRSFQPLSMDKSDLFATGHGMTLDAASHDRFVYGPSSKEDDEVSRGESPAKFPHILWGVRSHQRPLFERSEDPSGDVENFPLIMSTDGEDYPKGLLMEFGKIRDDPSSQRFGEKMEMKREGGHSLSIVQPLDVLRNRFLLDMARRRLENSRNQIEANKVILANMGKRNAGFSASERQDESLEAERSVLVKRNQRQDRFRSDQVPASVEFEV